MCGRFTLTTSPAKLREFFPLFDLPTFEIRFNIAPTQTVLAVRQLSHEEKPHGDMLQWGLIPSWADDPKIGYRLVNARSDSAADKPAFRSAFKKRRCLILADGFYEWKKEGRAKLPYHFARRDGQPLAFAGLWEHWKRDERVIDSCTILTTEANAVVEPLHDRMPVILSERDYLRWLDPRPGDPDVLREMMVPYPAGEMKRTAVDPFVNNARHEGPQCLEPTVNFTQPSLFTEES